MKRLIPLLLLFSLLCGCGSSSCQIAATTGPVRQFTAMLCEGTPLRVCQVVTDEVSCLHDYTLTVRQMKTLERAEVIVVSGAGLEEFMHDILHGHDVIDAGAQVSLLEMDGHTHEEHSHEHEHEHEHDPHIWLSPENALIMAQSICAQLCQRYPQYEAQFQSNLLLLSEKIQAVDRYGFEQLGGLSSRELITFHDGFAYLAAHYDLTILRAIEEESGSEASAKELIELIELVQEHQLNAIFTEVNGSASAAQILGRETGAKIYPLDMAMSCDDWFSAMYYNIDTLKEALE